MYRGHDYGGHNIPYPHPRPPYAGATYEVESFVDLSSVVGKVERTPVDLFKGDDWRPLPVGGGIYSDKFNGYGKVLGLEDPAMPTPEPSHSVPNYGRSYYSATLF